eukprot:7570415-Pyramimonas_sp.AAC.1
MNSAAKQQLPSSMLVAVTKRICNSWNTTRRYRQGVQGCRFGCYAFGGDCQLHYCSCPIAA